jgi:uncharacterized protein YdhG (YjbR/CyaY superfamily)
MQSKPTTVDEYLSEVPIERLQALTKLRELCRKELKGYDERVAYGSPCYAKDNIIEVFQVKKHFIGLYILKQEVFNQFVNELKGVTFGKGVVRFTKPEQINFTVIKKMLAGTYLSKDIICGHNQQHDKIKNS